MTGEQEQADDPLAFEQRPTCPACASAPESTLVDLPFGTGPIADHLGRFYEGRLDPARLGAERYVLDCCGSCGLVYQRAVLDAGSLDVLYGSIVQGSHDGTQLARGLDVRRRYSYEVEQFLKYLGRPPAEVHALDFGGGWGLWCDMAAAYGCQTATAELSVERAGATLGRGHRVLALDELEPGRFDVVNSEQVVEHLTHPAEVLERLAAAMRPGGLLRINVPNGTDIRDRLVDADWTAPKNSPRSLNAVAPLEHVNCFDHHSLGALVLGSGAFEPFDYPLRQFLDPLERVRYVASAVAHRARRRRGTLRLFRRR